MENVVLISGAASYYLLDLSGITIHLWGDTHTDPKQGSCQMLDKDLQCDSINNNFNGIIYRNANCWSILALLAEWFTYNNTNNISTDFYIEVPFTKSDKRNRINTDLGTINLRTSTDDRDDIYDPINKFWLTTAELYFHDCLVKSKMNCQYQPNVRMHYVDVRQRDDLSQSSNIYLLGGYHNLSKYLSDINATNYKEKLIRFRFEAEQLRDLILYLMENSHVIFEELYLNNKPIDRILDYKSIIGNDSFIGVNFHTLIANIYDMAIIRDEIRIDRIAHEFNRLTVTQPLVADKLRSFVHDELSAILRSGEMYGIKSGFTELIRLLDSSLDTIRINILNAVVQIFNELWHSHVFKNFSSIAMDIYSISRMLLQSDINQTQEIIVFAGNHHIKNYVKFFINYLGANSLYNQPSQYGSKCTTIPVLPKFNPYKYRL